MVGGQIRMDDEHPVMKFDDTSLFPPLKKLITLQHMTNVHICVGIHPKRRDFSLEVIEQKQRAYAFILRIFW
jgi:hypothetical protein